VELYICDYSGGEVLKICAADYNRPRDPRISQQPAARLRVRGDSVQLSRFLGSIGSPAGVRRLLGPESLDGAALVPVERDFRSGAARSCFRIFGPGEAGFVLVPGGPNALHERAEQTGGRVGELGDFNNDRGLGTDADIERSCAAYGNCAPRAERGLQRPMGRGDRRGKSRVFFACSSFRPWP